MTMEGALVDESAPPWDDEVIADEDYLHAAAAHTPEDPPLSAVTEAAGPVADSTSTAEPASAPEGHAADGEGAVSGTVSGTAPPVTSTAQAEPPVSTASAQDGQDAQTPAAVATDPTPAATAVANTSSALGNKAKKSRLGGNVEVTFTEEERERYKRLGMLSDEDGAQQEAKPQVDSRSRIYQALNPQRLYQEQNTRGVTKVRLLLIGVGIGHALVTI